MYCQWKAKYTTENNFHHMKPAKGINFKDLKIKAKYEEKGFLYAKILFLKMKVRTMQI